MDRKRSIISRSIIVAVLVLLPFAAFAQDPFVGNIRAIDSADPAAVAKIVRNGYAGLISGKPGDAVFTGDTIKTAEGVRVLVELSDKSVITVAPNSAVQMKGYLVNMEQGTRSSVMKALKGTVRFVIAKFFKANSVAAEAKWNESNVTIETMNAVAGVRGTDVAVTSQGSESEIAVLEGSVSVRHAAPGKNGTIILGAGQVTSVTKDRPPSPPAALSAERKSALEQSTKLVNPRTTANGKNGTAPKKTAMTAKEVAKDLAAGIPLSDVIDKAIESGMPLDSVVGAALDAGVPPSTLVYAAVTEGYSAKEVITSAVEHGAPLTAVAAAAIGAGADKAVVISGATDAGVPPAAIATAIATVTSSNASAYGTVTPLGSTPTTIIPAPVTSVSGGGGGTPSTLPASPYKP